MHVCVVRWDASDLLSGMRLVVLGEQRDGLPRLASPTGSADPVNVVFDGKWELQTSTISTSKNNISTSGRGDACTHGTVDNQLDLRDIQAARRDISGDENGRLAPLEGIETPRALLLLQIAVDASDPQTAALPQERLHARRLLLVQTEHQHALPIAIS